MLNEKSTKNLKVLGNKAKVLIYEPGNPRPYAMTLSDFKNESGITALENSVGGGSEPGGEFTYTEVAISSAEIRSIGTTPKQLLPAPGAGIYHEFYGTVEYTPGAAGYTHVADMLGVLGENSYGGCIFADLMVNTVENIVSFDHNGPVDSTVATGTYYGVQRRETNEALIFTSLNGTDPSGSGGATGTLLVKLYYREKTMGTEL